jgi:hypothetical protein
MLSCFPDSDRLGVGLSALCAAHCLVMPAAVSLLPLWPTLQTMHAWAHPLLLLLILPVVVAALRRDSGTGYVAPRALLGVGFLFLVGAWAGHDVLGGIGERIVTVLGSVLLIAGHVRNGRVYRACAESAPSLAEPAR